MKMLYIVRGTPGSGKSTLAIQLARGLQCPHFEHDDYLYNEDGEYVWTEGRMGYAVRQCARDTEASMAQEDVYDVVVSNVFPTAKSMKRYKKLAEQYGYAVTYIVVENRRGGKDVHNVPEDALKDMRDSFQIAL